VDVRTFRLDDPALAEHLAARAAARHVEPTRPAAREFSNYITGEMPATENTMVDEKRATKDEVVELPDGRQIQIQAKGAPVVDEKLAERERDLAKRTADAAEVDHLREIQPVGETKAIGTKTLAKPEEKK
jgi:hypothetical protein